MCTVSYSNGIHGRIITSNRDEHIAHKPAIRPKTYRLDHFELMYPKDPEKKGTWIAARKDGWVAVLLNGALAPFETSPRHTKSRGHIILDILRHTHIPCALNNPNWENVAPFTLILSGKHQLMKVQWDGKSRKVRELDMDRPYIWSSATLYDRGAMDRKAQDFDTFLTSMDYRPTPKEVLKFHKGHYAQQLRDLLYDDGKGIKTLSITQALPDILGGSLQYIELERTVHVPDSPKLVNPLHP